ncbi:monovalent cation/H+ antiporter subunit D, partial [Microvirga sp. BT689]|uniref:monovalent cation/H+ antiporter subunit D n=1 Tax=Microvirga arvi TaxID=2778731 RepID=UPI00194E1290
MTGMLDHLIIVPILLPLVSGAVMLLLNERRRTVKSGIGIATTVVLLIVSVTLLRVADMAPAASGGSVAKVYQLGNWPAPFGIMLVLDRLSALMLVLTSVLGIASLLYSLARWHRAGPRFHTLFQLQLMGLNGAFLTGDLFNLFVFFEVLLTASYGLVLHGDGTARVRAGLAYIAVNLAASLLFLIGASLAYGVTGTLNMADLASRIPALTPGDAALFVAAAAILGTAFLMKAGAWPLNFWLPTTYAAVSAPAAAIFAVMSKLGVYVILRLWTLVFGPEAGPLAGFGGQWLLVGGMLTMAFGTIGILASQTLSRLAGCSVLVSSGTV